MTQDVTKIKSKNWQHKRNTIGEIVTDTMDVRQCLITIATTQKGDVPFAPELGLDLMPAVAMEAYDAIDYLTAIYTKEIPIQEPRLEIIDVVGSFDDDGRIFMTIHWRLKGTTITEKTVVYPLERVGL